MAVHGHPPGERRVTAPSGWCAAGAAARASVPDAALSCEVVRALSGSPKTLPPKLFYDERGAALFEEICELPEYYLTRAELEILQARAGEIAALAGPCCALVEYGSGAGVKVRLLLDALDQPLAYVPIDISREQLERVSRELAEEYPTIVVRPVHGDYTAPIDPPSLPAGARRLAFFPGSTIGNFHPAEAAAFLTRVRRTIGPGGAIVLGVDRRKDAAILHAAYDDAAGVTAAFNLNMLERINREVGADFDTSRFAHRAVFNGDASRVEMHLDSLEPQTVHVAGASIGFAEGESIWTESSYKYDRARLDELVEAAGLTVRHLWSDSGDRFWVVFLESREAPRR
jgi:dimethylhistidine N-methyltransferase